MGRKSSTEKMNDPQKKDQGKSNVVGEVAETLKKDLNITPQSVTQAVIRDAKQAINYEIRKGFRDILKGIFSR
jgi:hypothetical protein